MAGVVGIGLGIIINYANFKVILSDIDRKDTRIGNPAYKSSYYTSRDSTDYIKYTKDAGMQPSNTDTMDFANVNLKTIHSVSF